MTATTVPAQSGARPDPVYTDVVAMRSAFQVLLGHLHRGGSWSYWVTFPQDRPADVHWFNGVPLQVRTDDDVFYGVHPTHQKGAKGTRAAISTVACVNAFYADVDTKHYGTDTATQAHIISLPLQPSVIISTGGGYHLYWLLTDTWHIDSEMTRDTISDTQRRLVHAVGGDPAASDIARVLRVPGTRNSKYRPPRTVLLRRFNVSTTYTRDTILDAIADVPSRATARPLPAVTSVTAPRPGSRRTTTHARHTPVPGAVPDTAPDTAPGAVPGAATDTVTVTSTAVVVVTDEERAAVSRYLDRQALRLSQTPVGGRNSLLNSITHAMGRLIASGHADESTVVRRLFAAGIVSGLDIHESLRTIQSGVAAGYAKGADYALLSEILAYDDAHDVRRTDTGNARRLCAIHGQDMRYVRASDTWLVWNGRYWQPDETGVVERYAKATVREMYREAAAIDDKDARKELLAHAQRSESARALRDMVRLARSEPGIAIDATATDAELYRLCVANGEVDLRSGALLPHDRDSLHTLHTDTPYDAAATAPMWDAFLARVVPDAQTRAFLQRAIGYSLTGDTCEQTLFFLYGSGANGKSTFVETLAALLGGYWHKAPNELVLRTRASGGIPHDVAATSGGIRLVVPGEIPQNARLDEAKIKDITGGDTLTARHLYQKSFSFRPRYKLWLYGNHKPMVSGTDHGIWRRIALVPFTQTIAPHERDATLAARLRSELPGILAWAVRGCVAWQRDGLGVPDVVHAATDEYRHESDVIGRFIDDCCDVRDDATAQPTPLWNAFMAWCDETGENPGKQNAFRSYLTAHGYQQERSGTRRYYRGLALRSQTPPRATPYAELPRQYEKGITRD